MMSFLYPIAMLMTVLYPIAMLMTVLYGETIWGVDV